MRILNLGCGTKTSSRPEVINIDQTAYLRIKSHSVLRVVAPLLMSGERVDRFNSLPENIMVHNVTRGLPFRTESIDVVYHSHLLEHLDKTAARAFLREVRRVLIKGGVHRIVVPDLEKACRDYIAHIAVAETDHAESGTHDSYVAAIIEQSVRREGSGTSRQKPFRRLLENAFLGDARRRGETHQWMYDRINLAALLTESGFTGLRLQSYGTSLVPDWSSYGLDLSDDGREYKPGSLYMEAQK
jgi:SAM-dependent methyltransferase